MPVKDRGLSRILHRLAEPLVLFPVIAILLLVVVWSSTSIVIFTEREAAHKSAMSSSLELVETYQAQMMRTLREIDQMLRVVKFAYVKGGGRIDLLDLKARGLLLQDPQFVVAIIDTDGRVMASTKRMPTGFSGEKSFKDSPGGDSLMISRPTRDPNDEWQLHFGRHLFAASGSIQGVVTVTVPAAYFVAGYDSAKLGHQGIIGIVGTDGLFRVRRTGDVLAFDGMATGDEIAAAAGKTTAVDENSWDRIRRYTRAREMLVYPLTVVVGLAEAEQMGTAADHAQTYLLRASGATLTLIGVLGILGFLSWQLSLSRTNAQRVHKAIESSVNAILITTLDKEGERTVEYANPAFETITGYATDEALGRNTAFLLGEDTGQSALDEIRSAIAERRDGHAVLRNYRKDGTLFWNDLYIAPVKNDRDQVTHFVEVMNDVTAAKTYEEQLAHQANFDTLTGLANRNLLHDRLQQSIAKARRDGGAVATMFIDIDNFKVINDSLGHRVGDDLLKQIAGRLKSCVREGDTVARLGGDEFVLVVHSTHVGAERVDTIFSGFVERLQQKIGAPLLLAHRPVLPTVSVGISLYPQDGEDAGVLLRHADAAMYRAKELGRNRFQFFTAEVHDRIQRRLELHSSLRVALEHNEFVLHYQPQMSLETGRIIAIEALLRWNHPERGLIGPGGFIEFAEETGLIIPIGNWVLGEACRQNRRWQTAGLPKVPVAVNTSAKQCEKSDAAMVVTDVLQKTGLEPKYLELEITESVSIANPEQSVPLLLRLFRTGVTLSIDDFGTGFSNLSYLRRFPVARLKIDHSFVRDITTDASCLAITQAIIAMAHSLKLQVVAEGVETEQQLELLRQNGCDVIQGNFFSPPVTHDAMARLLARNYGLPEPHRTAARRSRATTA